MIGISTELNPTENVATIQTFGLLKLLTKFRNFGIILWLYKYILILIFCIYIYSAKNHVEKVYIYCLFISILGRGKLGFIPSGRSRSYASQIALALVP